jgi:hypothetical protein
MVFHTDLIWRQSPAGDLDHGSYLSCGEYMVAHVLG